MNIFDGYSSGGALREICDFAGRIGRKNFRESTGKQAAGEAMRRYTAEKPTSRTPARQRGATGTDITPQG